MKSQDIECWEGMEAEGRGAWNGHGEGFEKGEGTRRWWLGGLGINAHAALVVFLHQRTSPAPSSAPRVPSIPHFSKCGQKMPNVRNTNPSASQPVLRTVWLEKRQEGDDSQRSPQSSESC